MITTGSAMPQGHIEVEWNVLDEGFPYLQPWTESEHDARSYLDNVTGPLVCRSRITYDVVVSQWVAIPGTGNEDDPT